MHFSQGTKALTPNGQEPVRTQMCGSECCPGRGRERKGGCTPCWRSLYISGVPKAGMHRDWGSGDWRAGLGVQGLLSIGMPWVVLHLCSPSSARGPWRRKETQPAHDPQELPMPFRGFPMGGLHLISLGTFSPSHHCSGLCSQNLHSWLPFFPQMEKSVTFGLEPAQLSLQISQELGTAGGNRESWLRKGESQ